MKRTQKYIIQEILPMFIMGNFLFMFLLLLEKLVTLADLFFAKNVSVSIMIETIIYFMPSIFMMTVPLAALLSVLIAFGRLSADSELTVMRAMGASSRDLVKPVVFFGACASILALFMSLYLSEKGSALALNNLTKIVENISISDLQENEMYSGLPGVMLFVGKKNSDTDFEKIIAVSKGDGTVITALRGYVKPAVNRAVEINFLDGRATFISKEGDISGISFKNMLFNMPLNVNVAAAVKSPMVMTTAQLIKSVKEPKNAFELSKRFSLPVSTIIMSVLGYSLGVFFARGGKSFGVIVSICIAFVYNFLMLYFENLTGKSPISPLLAAWLPNVVLCLILLPLMKRTVR